MNDIQELTIKELLSSNEYRIPIYQRNYAWGVGETTQLIQDIADYAKDSPVNNYYIGNLIVFPRHKDNSLYFETIDGQQRTTTITILLCALKHNYSKYDLAWYSKVNLSFDHREKSNLTLFALHSNPEAINYSVVNANIMAVYNKAWSIVYKICQDKEISVSSFIDYLLNKVIILRISVPKDTNLNHYFEIMNSRGEQLEQHEIVKAQLMAPIKEDQSAMAAFNLIWEACSNMDRYVQLNFSKTTREQIFDNNGTESIKITFKDLAALYSKNSVLGNEKNHSLMRLFVDAANNTPYSKPWEDGTDKDQSEAYHSLITFSNFLLHALKIIRPDNKEVVLDDKRLTKIFKSVVKSERDAASFSIEFIMKLLDIRFLFDRYIIKRKQDKWSLKKLSPQKADKDKYYYKDTFSQTESEDDRSGQNRNIVTLLSMFHVSAPTQIYKHWMNASLYYVYNHRNTNASEYAEYLWNLSKAYMLDRYLAVPEKKVPFETIIFKNNGKSVNHSKDILWSNINIDEYPQKGEHVENFVFNFYDYLLLRETNDADFEFSYRTSVEHFYPQHPTDKEPMDFNHLHSFGNLCLVSRGMNSKFTNNLPGAKYENFGDAKAMKTYSLKLKSMMNTIKKGERWDETKIVQEEQDIKELISKALSSNEPFNAL